jgi:hypothetical protein
MNTIAPIRNSADADSIDRISWSEVPEIAGRGLLTLLLSSLPKSWVGLAIVLGWKTRIAPTLMVGYSLQGTIMTALESLPCTPPADLVGTRSKQFSAKCDLGFQYFRDRIVQFSIFGQMDRSCAAQVLHFVA